MSEDKATARPWRLQPGDSTRIQAVLPDEEEDERTVVATFHSSSFAPPRAEAVENARLCLAAVNGRAEMVEVVRELAEALGWMLVYHRAGEEPDPFVIEKAEEADARADALLGKPGDAP